jgi:hypothetical protein
MSQSIATEQLVFDDFHKDDYRAFKIEGESRCVSLPTIRDRLLDMLVTLERQMEQGDHLAITLTVSRPTTHDTYDFDSIMQPLRNAIMRRYP